MNLPPVLRLRYFDSNGNPLAGGKLYSYTAGTTTPQSTYTDQGGLSANANPLVLDANGEAAMWLDPTLSYKFILKDSSDVQQWSVDNVIGTLSANAVATGSIQDLAVTTAKLALDSVDSTILKDSVAVDADRAVTTNHIRNGAVTGAKLDSSVADASTLELSGTSIRIKDAGVSTAKIADASITNPKMGTANYVKGSTVNTSGTNGSLADVGSLNVTITTSSANRPIEVCLEADGGASPSWVVAGTGVGGTEAQADFSLCRGSTSIAQFRVNVKVGSSPGEVRVPPSCIRFLDTGASVSTSTTYKIQAMATGTGGTPSWGVVNCKLLAREV